MLDYFFSTPIGKDLSGLARAMGGGLGAKTAGQLGVMESRQQLYDEQAANEVAERELWRQRVATERQKTRDLQDQAAAQSELANVFRLMPNAPMVAPPLPAEATPMPVAPAAVSADYNLGAPALPEAVGGYVPSVRVNPRTKQELAAEAYAQAVLAGHQTMGALPKMFLGYGGAMDATAPDLKNLPYGPARLTSLGVGAGEPYGQTPLGTAAHEQRLGGEAAQRDATVRRGQDVRDDTARRGQDVRAGTAVETTNIREAGKAARDAAKPGGGQKPLRMTVPQQQALGKKIEAQLAAQGVESTPQQRAGYVDAVVKRMAGGESYASAAADVVASMTEETAPAEKKWFGKDKPATRALVPPKLAADAPAQDTANKPAAAAPAAAPAAAGKPLVIKTPADLPPVDKRTKGLQVTFPNGKTATWDGAKWK